MVERYAYKELTLQIACELLGGDQFRHFAHVVLAFRGRLVIESYLGEAEPGLHRLFDWVGRRGTPIWIRLLKSSY